MLTVAPIRLLLAILVTLGFALGTASATAPTSDFLDTTLPNGLRVVIVRNRIAPVVATEMTYLVGSRDDPPQFPGMAHAQEHMMYRGTHNISGAELGTIATALGGDFNAQTKETTTQYSFTVPAADLEVILRIEADRMRAINDDQSAWQIERGAIEQEVAADLSQPGNDFFDHVRAIAFRGTGYEHDGVGTKAAFDRLTGSELQEFHARWYAPNNAVLVIAGDVEPTVALAQVRAHFAAIPRRPIASHAIAHPPTIQRTVLHERSTMIYPLATVAYRFPGISDRDFLPSYVLQAMLGSATGPLQTLQDSGDALDAEWSSMPYVPEGQIGFASVALPPGANPAEMTVRVEHILNDWATHGVPRDLFRLTQQRLIAEQEESRNSISELASDWSDTIAIDGEPTIAHEQDLIAAVTQTDVNRVARNVLDPRHAIVGDLTPSADASHGDGLSAPAMTRENPLDRHPAATTMPAWARSLVHSLSLPASPLHPTSYRLANGVRVIVQPESISDAVFVFGSIRTLPALQEPADQVGISSVLGNMFAAGSAHLDRIAFRHALDSINASVRTGTNFGLEARPATFEHGLALLADAELHPRFDEATFELARRQSMQELETALNSTRTQAVRGTEHALLPAADPTLREPTLSGLAGLRLDAARAYYATVFRPDLATIVVVGNVSPDRARAAIEHEFGSWHTNGSAPVLRLPSVPLNAPQEVIVPVPSMQQSAVTLTETLNVTRDDPQRAALEVGNAILGGGRVAPQQTRLFRDLRQNSGLVYSVYSQLHIGDMRSRFEIGYASDPSNEQRLLSLVNDEVERMRSEPVDPSELALMKAALVRSAIVSDESVAAIGGSLLAAASAGQSLDRARVDTASLLTVDQAAIQHAFATTIDPKRFVRTILHP